MSRSSKKSRKNGPSTPAGDRPGKAPGKPQEAPAPPPEGQDTGPQGPAAAIQQPATAKKPRILKRDRRPPRPPKPNKLTAEREARQRAFLEAFRTFGVVTAAANAAGIHRLTHYEWLKDDPTGYGAEYAHAEGVAIDRLEQEARRRALVGVDEPVFYKGERIGAIRKYSDSLLMFLLNGRRGDVFKYRSEVTGPKGGPIQVVEAKLDLAAVARTPAEREALRAMLQRSLESPATP